MSNLKRQNHNNIGKIGENVATKFLTKNGYHILDRNYLRKWGEIDIVAKHRDIIHFIEVKSVSCESSGGVIRESGDYRPEDNVHQWKLKRLRRIIQTYLLDKNIADEDEWQFDVAAVYLDLPNRISKIRYIEDIGI